MGVRQLHVRSTGLVSMKKSKIKSTNYNQHQQEMTREETGKLCKELHLEIVPHNLCKHLNNCSV